MSNDEKPPVAIQLHCLFSAHLIDVVEVLRGDRSREEFLCNALTLGILDHRDAALQAQRERLYLLSAQKTAEYTRALAEYSVMPAKPVAPVQR